MINVLIKKLSLKELVFAVVLVPIIGYLILATGVLRESWARLTKASTLGQDFALIDPISDLVHECEVLGHAVSAETQHSASGKGVDDGWEGGVPLAKVLVATRRRDHGCRGRDRRLVAQLRRVLARVAQRLAP